MKLPANGLLELRYRSADANPTFPAAASREKSSAGEAQGSVYCDAVAANAKCWLTRFAVMLSFVYQCQYQHASSHFWACFDSGSVLHM